MSYQDTRDHTPIPPRPRPQSRKRDESTALVIGAFAFLFVIAVAFGFGGLASPVVNTQSSAITTASVTIGDTSSQSAQPLPNPRAPAAPPPSR